MPDTIEDQLKAGMENKDQLDSVYMLYLKRKVWLRILKNWIHNVTHPHEEKYPITWLSMFRDTATIVGIPEKDISFYMSFCTKGRRIELRSDEEYWSAYLKMLIDTRDHV